MVQSRQACRVNHFAVGKVRRRGQLVHSLACALNERRERDPSGNSALNRPLEMRDQGKDGISRPHDLLYVFSTNADDLIARLGFIRFRLSAKRAPGARDIVLRVVLGQLHQLIATIQAQHEPSDLALS